MAPSASPLKMEKLPTPARAPSSTSERDEDWIEGPLLLNCSCQFRECLSPAAPCSASAAWSGVARTTCSKTSRTRPEEAITQLATPSRIPLQLVRSKWKRGGLTCDNEHAQKAGICVI